MNPISFVTIRKKIVTKWILRKRIHYNLKFEPKILNLHLNYSPLKKLNGRTVNVCLECILEKGPVLLAWGEILSTLKLGVLQFNLVGQKSTQEIQLQHSQRRIHFKASHVLCLLGYTWCLNKKNGSWLRTDALIIHLSTVLYYFYSFNLFI